MANIASITSPIWGLSTLGTGAVVQGLNSIRQCITIILRTTRGTDPLRPEFGTLIYKWADKPTPLAIPNIKNEIIQAIARWEERVTVTSVTHKQDGSHLTFYIGYKVYDSDVLQTLAYTVNDLDKVAKLVLQGIYPANPMGYRYKIKLVLNGSDKLPSAPEFGFGTLAEMYYWVQVYWGSYGAWQATADRLILTLNDGSYTSGKLEVSIVALYRYVAEIDIAPPYRVRYSQMGAAEVPGEWVNTPARLLQQATDYFGPYGEWRLEQAPGSFDESFSDDYFTDRTVLALYTSDTGININIIN